MIRTVGDWIRLQNVDHHGQRLERRFGWGDFWPAYSAAMNLHLKILDGGNNHHMAEALFKAFGKALDMATMEEPRMKDIWSTKGSL